MATGAPRGEASPARCSRCCRGPEPARDDPRPASAAKPLHPCAQSLRLPGIPRLGHERRREVPRERALGADEWPRPRLGQDWGEGLGELSDKQAGASPPPARGFRCLGSPGISSDGKGSGRSKGAVPPPPPSGCDASALRPGALFAGAHGAGSSWLDGSLHGDPPRSLYKKPALARGAQTCFKGPPASRTRRCSPSSVFLTSLQGNRQQPGLPAGAKERGEVPRGLLAGLFPSS